MTGNLLAPLEKPCLLLVHPDPAFRVALLQQLGRHGYRVVAQGALSAARESARVEPPEVIILDEEVGESAGRLKELEWAEGFIPVILLLRSGGQPADWVRQLCGKVDYCYKPCPVDELVAKIEAARRWRFRLPSQRVGRWPLRMWLSLRQLIRQGFFGARPSG